MRYLIFFIFYRHQEQHLGVNERWQNKARLRSRYILRKRRENPDPVIIRLHNVTSDQFLRIVYSVSVSGHPVLATTAARDMNYVSDAEVVAELGFPVFTKAERNYNFNFRKLILLLPPPPPKKNHV